MTGDPAAGPVPRERREEVEAAAATILRWLEDREDPFGVAVATGQAAVEASDVLRDTGSVGKGQHAFVRRWLESVARGNGRLIAMLHGFYGRPGTGGRK